MGKKNRFNDIEYKQGKDEYNFVLYVPEITHNDWHIVDGKVLLNFKINNPITKFVGYILKKEPKKDMLFDNMCTSVWLLIDGERSIYEIAKIQNHNKEEFKEDLRRLIEFIKYISKQGWIKYKSVKKREEINSLDGLNYVRSGKLKNIDI
ncbi:PqqD family peptide modification chaperone [Sedimentibacter sp.]|uniref:PqqD family peptide modification chaperone n=1 Tax=Sedimentibacter sp. TaxID=1960295 RepID=UPI0028AB0504|nr:PqqD family peptide modification chaperone [Sedimentibacter sp.]